MTDMLPCNIHVAMETQHKSDFHKLWTYCATYIEYVISSSFHIHFTICSKNWHTWMTRGGGLRPPHTRKLWTYYIKSGWKYYGMKDIYLAPYVRIICSCYMEYKWNAQLIGGSLWLGIFNKWKQTFGGCLILSDAFLKNIFPPEGSQRTRTIWCKSQTYWVVSISICV